MKSVVKKKKHPSAVERIILSIGGLAGMGAFFLPFFQGISGLKIVQGILSWKHIVSSAGGEEMLAFFQHISEVPAGIERILAIVAVIIVIVVPTHIVFIALIFFLRGLAGRKSYKSGLVYGIIYSAVCAALFALAGGKIGMESNFIKLVGAGYWLSMACLIIGRFSTFARGGVRVTPESPQPVKSPPPKRRAFQTETPDLNTVPEEAGNYELILQHSGIRKEEVIEVISKITNKDFKGAKVLVDNVPSTIKEHISERYAQAAKRAIEAAGGGAKVINR
ncbi:MAG: ribosomal protein L7/L12 [candidate division Zixibacteria bacterium]|nr:ribosomal protein L7/L12 [Candidatus Tariuqbacter arcticus]